MLSQFHSHLMFVYLLICFAFVYFHTHVCGYDGTKHIIRVSPTTYYHLIFNFDIYYTYACCLLVGLVS